MITKDNLKNVLSSLCFKKATIGEYYTKTFSTCDICVDFDNEKLVYPENKGLVVNDKTTSNFSHNENFVVFECVCRLLEKGYRPEHIELEPKWQFGRDAKGGKADIIVKDENGDTLIIIECKTAGAEYNKEVKNTEEYGGQLFSYWQQENAARWLVLYASDWKDECVVVKSQVINCTDDANVVKMAEKDKNVLIYSNAHTDKERFAVWDETYNEAWIDNLIFDEDSQAYNIGIPPLRKNKLRDFTPEDKIVNRFEEILRHNNVSDKENAFNRLIALFICKLVDEIKKQDFEEVEFQYKQGTDTYETLQDRLQRLHTQGMEEFMKEKIFYVAADYAERLFMQYTGKKRKQAIEDLNNTIRILKFYSNNDFAFKDVHNEELFFQNGKILVEVVQLFQPYRIVYPSKHQFLGDLFEQLLNKGFKQNEGQFFTPTPITRFIWDCLPLQTYISDHGLPNVIDYACGAGHFLTEAIEAINSVRMDNDNSWVEKHIYGVEKDYRLARVSKISMFMNGAGGANIIFGDGLENYKDKGIENGVFDILVANPPYSVSGFKSHLKLRNNNFHLLDVITNDGKEIETLFVERIAQLLRPQGLAAVILPASILSNSSNSYIAAREELLKNFYIRAIVSFGSKTFGATGTNTVTLFLERYKEPPCIAKLTEDSVDAIMGGEDISNFMDKQILADYLQMQNVSEGDYLRFIRRELNLAELSANLYFKVYVDAFNVTAVILPKKCSEEEAKRIRMEKIYDFALGVEKDKLYYFALVREQRTLVITSPTDNSAQKEFLGYDWSNRKGAEGIVVNVPGGKMYCNEDRFARGTLASAVRNAFVGAYTQLSDDLMKYIGCHWLKDMFDWSRVEFDKGVNIAVKSVTAYMQTNRYELANLGDVAEVASGNSAPQDASMFSNGIYPFFRTSDVGKVHLSKALSETQDKLNENGILGMRLFRKGTILFPKSGASTYLDHRVIMGVDGYVASHLATIIANNKLVLNDYLYEILINVSARTLKTSTGYPSLKKEDIEKIKLPLPPMEVQKEIVSECAIIDIEYRNSRSTIQSCRDNISHIFENLETECDGGATHISLSDLVNIKNGLNYVLDNDGEQYTIVGVKDFQDRFSPVISELESIKIHDELSAEYKLQKDDILCVRSNGSKKLVGRFLYIGEIPDNITFSGFTLRLRLKSNAISAKFLCYYLRTKKVREIMSGNSKGSNIQSVNQKTLYSLVVPVPSMNEQNRILQEVSEYERQIEKSQEVILGYTERKKAVLEHYLK